MHRLSRLIGLNASCFLVALALSSNAGCGDSKRSGRDNDAGRAGDAGASEAGAGGDGQSGGGGTSPSGGSESGGVESGGTESGGTESGGAPDNAGTGGESDTAGTGGTSGESGAGTGGVSAGTSGTAGSDEGGSGGMGGEPQPPRGTGRLVPGGAVMTSARYTLVGSMADGIAEGTRSASANYELHGFVAGPE